MAAGKTESKDIDGAPTQGSRPRLDNGPHPDYGALVDKYEWMAQARAKRDAQGHGRDPEPEATKSRLRRFSEQYPGALRELDRLSLDEIESRAAAARHAQQQGPGTSESAKAAARGDAAGPWLAAVWSYHAFIRVALAMRRHAGEHGDTRPAHDIEPMLRDACGADFLRSHRTLVLDALRAPAKGRLSKAALALTARVHDVPEDALSDFLFPPR